MLALSDKSNLTLPNQSSSRPRPYKRYVPFPGKLVWSLNVPIVRARVVRGRVVLGTSCLGDELSYYINRGRVVGDELSGDELSVGELSVGELSVGELP